MFEFSIGIAIGLLGFATGIFTVLSLVEKPIWRLMRLPYSTTVSDETARTIHQALKRVIHLLPPTMITTMLSVSFILAYNLFINRFETPYLIVSAVFFTQFVLVASLLKKRINDVDNTPSDGEIRAVRKGLGALARLHHQGLVMVFSTILAIWVLLPST